jgi:hypothetical protein
MERGFEQICFQSCWLCSGPIRQIDELIEDTLLKLENQQGSTHTNKSFVGTLIRFLKRQPRVVQHW